MKTYMQLVAEYAIGVTEVFPWDVEDSAATRFGLILDIREPYEFSEAKIKDSVNVPRGILESACEWNYEETVPNLVKARDKEILVVCRSGHRSVLACYMMQLLGYSKVFSLKTGLRGWFEYERELVDAQDNIVKEDTLEQYFASQVKNFQLEPELRAR